MPSSLAVQRTVAELRARGDRVADEVLADNAGRWVATSARDLARIRAVAHEIARRLLDEPAASVEQLPEGPLLDHARAVLGLEAPASRRGWPDATPRRRSRM